MIFDERENNLRFEQDFQNDETNFRKQEPHFSSLYDSITVCGDHESQYFRDKCKAAWDDEDLDDNLEEENDNYYEDESEELESFDRPL